MTTIACNKESIAGDQWVTWDGHRGYRTPKLFHIKDSIYGTAGDWAGGVFIEWAKEGFKVKSKPQFMHYPAWDEMEFDILELAPDGIWLWDKYLVRTQVNEDNYAVGSGGKAAIIFMRELGLTPEQAVLKACDFDEYTKEPVDVIYLGKT